MICLTEIMTIMISNMSFITALPCNLFKHCALIRNSWTYNHSLVKVCSSYITWLEAKVEHVQYLLITNTQPNFTKDAGQWRVSGMLHLSQNYNSKLLPQISTKDVSTANCRKLGWNA